MTIQLTMCTLQVDAKRSNDSVTTGRPSEASTADPVHEVDERGAAESSKLPSLEEVLDQDEDPGDHS